MNPLNPQPTFLKPAEQLVGQTLEGGWIVTQCVPKAPGATGGCFSVGYLVKRADGKEAFLKALDFSGALADPQPTVKLQELAESYNFEKDLLHWCRELGMDRVATAIDEGNFRLPGGGMGSLIPVPYLIFERAQGDVRSQMNFSHQLDLQLCFKILHQIATGLWQLHKHEVAHQDVKPSNVLMFNDKDTKLADLGRAARRGFNPPHEKHEMQGDPKYAPPELLYRSVSEDWYARRQGCDLYLMGSLVAYLFVGTAITPEIFRRIPQHQWPWYWKGTYSEIFPVIEKAYGETIAEIKANLPHEFLKELHEIIIQLSDPELSRRGHPKGRGIKGEQFSMERYVTIFDRLAFRASTLARQKA